MFKVLDLNMNEGKPFNLRYYTFESPFCFILSIYPAGTRSLGDSRNSAARTDGNGCVHIRREICIRNALDPDAGRQGCDSAQDFLSSLIMHENH